MKLLFHRKFSAVPCSNNDFTVPAYEDTKWICLRHFWAWMFFIIQRVHLTINVCNVNLCKCYFTEGEYVLTEQGTNERSGFGSHTTTDGTKYTGTWQGDKMNGTGKIEFANGSTYEGIFVNNKFEGKGKYTWPNGSFYEGDFTDSKWVLCRISSFNSLLSFPVHCNSVYSISNQFFLV